MNNLSRRSGTYQELSLFQSRLRCNNSDPTIKTVSDLIEPDRRVSA